VLDEGGDGWDFQQSWGGRIERHAEFWYELLKERDH
jgi:hypothetical protein